MTNQSLAITKRHPHLEEVLQRPPTVRAFPLAKRPKSLVSLGGMAVLMLALGSSAHAFTLIKDVNTGSAPTEKVVIFDKARGSANQVSFVMNNAPTAINSDGAIQTDITGYKAMSVEINWKPQDNLPATFDATQYNYLVVTCGLEGAIHTGPPKADGTYSSYSTLGQGNYYFETGLADASGQYVGYVNLADVTDDGVTPFRIVTLNIPMVLFIKGTVHDPTHIRGILFTWGATHPNISRDVHLVVEKIALAD